jgi:hypothetical protein
MSELNEWAEFKDTLRLFTVWAASIFVDSTFLAIWVVVQWFLSSKIIAPLKLSGIDYLVLFVFQILFAVSTLSPIAITIYRDIVIMILRTQRTIRREIEIGKHHESD